MAQPTPFVRDFSFTDFSAATPSGQQPGTSLDAEFDAAALTLAEVLANLVLIQRDDGALANQTVGLDTISPALVAALHLIGADVGVWATGTAYVAGAFLVDGATVYMAVSAHTSAALLATDVTAGRMIAVFGGAVGGIGLTDGSKGEVVVSGLGAIWTLAASLALTGNPTAATQAAGDSTTRLATTAFVQAAIAALINSAPGALDTLNELAAALGNDANFAATMVTALAGKQPLDADLTAIAALAGQTTYGQAFLTLVNSAGLMALLTYATAAEVRAGTVSNKAIAPDKLIAAAAPQTLTPGATIAWDMSLGFVAKVTLGSAANAFQAPTNPVEGLTYRLEAIQDATGSRTATWNAAFDWGSVGTPTLSTGAAKHDFIYLDCYDASTPKFRAVFNKAA